MVDGRLELSIPHEPAKLVDGPYGPSIAATGRSISDDDVSRAADSSVTIAALLIDHPAHQVAAEALAGCDTTIAHVVTETYGVLTRLPPPSRIDAITAGDPLLRRAWDPFHATGVERTVGQRSASRRATSRPAAHP